MGNKFSGCKPIKTVLENYYDFQLAADLAKDNSQYL
jgi:hypothetical protein